MIEWKPNTTNKQIFKKTTLEKSFLVRFHRYTFYCDSHI